LYANIVILRASKWNGVKNGARYSPENGARIIVMIN
jgi:hypothetical protein